MIITSFKLDKDQENEALILDLDREYPKTYLDTDKFIIEKYKLDTDSLEVREELAKALKSQTVLQYMSDRLTMSSVFYMVPINNYKKLDFITRAANFYMNPEFIDITDFIKNQNTTFFDYDTNEKFLYLYRIVYNYNNEVFATDYIAGFENIPKKPFSDTSIDRPTYKNNISDDTFKELYGNNWEIIKKYIYTDYHETRYQYRQEPIVFKIPLQRFNERYQGPLENYKILPMLRNLSMFKNFISNLKNKIKIKLDDSYDLVDDINEKIEKNYKLSNDEIEGIKEDILKTLNLPDSLLSLQYKQNNQHRIFEVDSFSTSIKIPEILNSNGLYIVLKTIEEAKTIYDLLLSKNLKLSEDIFIMVLGNSVPIYKIEESI